MVDLYQYADHPFAFVWRYVRLRKASHAVIFGAVVVAVACSVGTQYGVKFLVDMDREFDSCRRDGRCPPRSVSLPDRPCAQLFRGAAAGHADKPDHVDVQCCLYGRKYVRMECHAALHCDGGGNRAGRDGQRSHERRADRYRRHRRCGDVPLRGRR
jgi:hypothetical protein